MSIVIASPHPEQRRSRRTGRRAGFTLLEMFLTLALLAIIAAMAWPALERPFADQRLKRAADSVRAALVAARVAALESGRAYQFRHTPGSNRFRIDREDVALAAAGSTTSGTSGNSDSASSSESQSTSELTPATEQYTLPVSVIFVPTDGRIVDGSAVAEASESSSAETAAWAEQPIVFNPDGTTVDASIVLQNEYGDSIELTLRGLTGVVLVGATRSPEEGTR